MDLSPSPESFHLWQFLDPNHIQSSGLSGRIFISNRENIQALSVFGLEWMLILRLIKFNNQQQQHRPFEGGNNKTIVFLFLLVSNHDISLFKFCNWEFGILRLNGNRETTWPCCLFCTSAFLKIYLRNVSCNKSFNNFSR